MFTEEEVAGAKWEGNEISTKGRGMR